jgi:hypothetical protein
MIEIIASHVSLISSFVKVGCIKNINEVSPSSVALTTLFFGLNQGTPNEFISLIILSRFHPFFNSIDLTKT